MTQAGSLTRSDVDLVDSVRSGDMHAFAELYRQHSDAVRRVAASQIRGSDAVADVVQETFTQALHKLHQLREADRFRPWLLAIARNTATNMLRSGMRTTAFDEGQTDEIVASGPEPEELNELRELAEQVEGCVAGLSKRDATAIAMVTHLGFTPEQVGAALDLSPGAAKVVVHRARRRLRQALVLQLLVRQPDLACGEFQALLSKNPLAAEKHLQSCEICLDAAVAEVVPFSFDEAGVTPAGDIPAGDISGP